MVHYPHLKEFESIIWQRALDAKTFSGTFKYDVHVGEGFHDDHENSCTIVCDDFKILTQKRIDVVNETTSEINLIEITPKLSSRVLGQAIAYKILYNKQFPTGKIIKSFAVVESLDDDLLPIFKEHRIEVLRV